jgi:hypothetical protein
MNMEHSLFDMQNRMVRWEENQFMLSSRCQALAECLVKCHQVGSSSLLKKQALTLLVDKLNFASLGFHDPGPRQRLISRWYVHA